MPKDRRKAQENFPLPKKKNWTIHAVATAMKIDVEGEYLSCEKFIIDYEEKKRDIKIW